MKSFARSSLFLLALAAGIASALPTKNATAVFTYDGEEYPIRRAEQSLLIWTPMVYNGEYHKNGNGVIEVIGINNIVALQNCLTNLAAALATNPTLQPSPNNPLRGGVTPGITTMHTGWRVGPDPEDDMEGIDVVDSGMLSNGNIVLRVNSTPDGTTNSVILYGCPMNAGIFGTGVPSLHTEDGYGNPFIPFGEGGAPSMTEFAAMLDLPPDEAKPSDSDGE